MKMPLLPFPTLAAEIAPEAAPVVAVATVILALVDLVRYFVSRRNSR
jgi:hypothetical protein